MNKKEYFQLLSKAHIEISSMCLIVYLQLMSCHHQLLHLVIEPIQRGLEQLDVRHPITSE